LAPLLPGLGVMTSDYIDYSSEERVKASLAEMSLSEQLLGLARIVEDILREANGIMRDLVEGRIEDIRSRYDRVNGLKNRAEEMKDSTLAYMARLGIALSTAGYYKDVCLFLSRIAQLLDGAAYRAKVYLEAGCSRLPRLISSELLEFMENLTKQYTSLVEAVRLLLDNPRKSYDMATNVIIAEDRLDQLYRQLVLNMYQHLRDHVPSLLLVRDLIDYLEDSADTAREAAENIRFLALYRSSVP